MDRLGLEFISTLGMNPVDAIRLTAELGVHRTGIAPSPITANPHGFAPWDLRSDPALVRATKAAAQEHGVAIALGEGFLVMPGIEIVDTESAMDIMAELGAPVVNAVVIEQDRQRAIDEFGRFAAMAAERALVATIEFMPLMWPATIAEALAFLGDVGAINGKLLLDSMHVYRSGASTTDVAAIYPAMIGYIQICDVPMPALTDNYGEEARHDRLVPGEGDLPLADFLGALPAGLTVGLEVPMVSKAQAGINLRDALAPCIAASRRLLS
ncbi:sugar phosphate isomerase/epimerase [Novosphingobium sp. G106]|uniref:sugar phosphate isomerase/epimerase family protein n=1 Tax=Novosphingobium sp. G106 TaxID=2849500 RepID=UPI001C2D0AD3|nr:TIM barrel protein [Novosphingobium sp. G106]MBV1686813.1 sugar phosphate isomerase/epimerase [Novosphingobium sp. G106]